MERLDANLELISSGREGGQRRVHIVLDSSVICADFHMEGSNFRLLFGYIGHSDNILYIAQVVVEEIKNKFREKLYEHEVMIKKLASDSRSYVGNTLNSLQTILFHKLWQNIVLILI